jgi:hypothetical protein
LKERVVKIFGEEPTDSVKITSMNRIIEILNTIGKDKVLNHTFMPSGGGLNKTNIVITSFC